MATSEGYPTGGMCCPGEQAAALGWIPVRLEEESTLVVKEWVATPKSKVPTIALSGEKEI